MFLPETREKIELGRKFGGDPPNSANRSWCQEVGQMSRVFQVQAPLVGLRSKTSLYRYDALLTSAGKSGRLACKKRVRRDALLTSAGKSERLACKKRVRRDALLTSADVALRAVKPTLNRYRRVATVSCPSGTKYILPIETLLKLTLLSTNRAT